ncbi:DUF6541 family protein [Arthrobacter sp. OAP107]|uniref:DUF6541 family protein n=1 Tax=Arthrobacter sp. OAP107 TaxID=3156445 RepID=UPI00339A155F
MSWMQTIPTIIVGLLVLFIPGALLARTMGARGLTLWSASAPLTVSIASVGAVLLQMLNIRWSVASMVLVTLLLTLAAAALRVLWLRRASGHWPRPEIGRLPGILRSAGYLMAMGIPAAIISVRFSKIFAGPEHISQTYDNVFHLNALRVIADSGRASSLTLASLDANSNRLSFYPAAWHDVVALVLDASQTSIPVAVNVSNMIIAAVVWPLSAMFLISTLTGRRPVPMMVTGALAAGFGSFPYLMVDFGVLYPTLLAISMLPFCLGAVVELLGTGRDRRASTILYAGLLGVASVGLTLAHPSTTMTLIALAVAPLLVWFVTRSFHLRGQEHWIRKSMIGFAAVVAYGAVTWILWVKVRPSEAASFWPPVTTLPRAIGEAITSAPQSRDVPWLIFALTIVGIVILCAQRKLWILGCFVISLGFYAVVAGYPAGPTRSFWTGVWYNDTYRLAALLPITALVISAIGGSWLIERSLQLAQRRLAPSRRPALHVVSFAVSAVLVLTAAALTQGRSINTEQAKAAQSYSSTDASPLLSSDEEALLRRLDQHVPAGSVVVGNPWTGASLVYAYSGRNAMLPAISSSPSPSERVILSRLKAVAKDPEVCEMVARENSYYVLDFGAKEVHQGKHYPALTSLAGTPGLRLLDSQGAAGLYEVAACR